MPPKRAKKKAQPKDAHSPPDEARIREDFNGFDTDGDGVITRDELAAVFRRLDAAYWNDARLSRLMDEVDINKDGKIVFEEFFAWIECGGEDAANSLAAAKMRSEAKLAQSHLIADCRSTAGASDEYLVEFEQERGAKLGVQVDTSDTRQLTIIKISDGGLVAQWNQSQQWLQVMKGDMISSVNGVAGDSKEMLRELNAAPFRGSRHICLALQPKATKYRYVSRLEDAYDVDVGLIDNESRFHVREATNRHTKQQVMVKSFHKANGKALKVCDTEVQALKMLDHPNVIRLFEVFEDFQDVHLVTERCTGGELLERVICEDRFREADAARVMRQVFAAIAHMQSRFVCHRDVRPENILLQSRVPIEQGVVKLTGFSYAKGYKDGPGTFNSVVGQCMYRSPQVNAGYYDRACDLWSCGIMLYLIICGYPPFAGETDYATSRQADICELSFPRSDFLGVSEECLNMIAGLITKDPTLRLTVERCLSHDWMMNYVGQVAEVSLEVGQRRLKKFGGFSLFKKAALQAAACRLRPAEIDELGHMFKVLDKNGDSTITVYELREGLSKLGKPELIEDIIKITERVDMDGNQRIDYSEFLAATLDQRRFADEHLCWAAFRVFDRDNSGSICRQELEQVLRSGHVQSAIGASGAEAALKECDVNGDGKIDFQEFMAMMRAGAGTEDL